ncbi:hypothetical protein GCM10010885_21650 [Alicyclobacillus cellulosilyticus]|uniref:DUF1648 domain-containing protein n=1 Tax=Alicyclobacillus cellulosilyticus TaxID=1003997 RepID=A0A917KH04_9BACL|nr:DUF5808 domain-containing protein [Alicyclobacillus cellulosilyticus]GGJ11953.1 hypothetical protein GCM10010885_21650 [Alicyclobacillus cellulosilyticus]
MPVSVLAVTLACILCLIAAEWVLPLVVPPTLPFGVRVPLEYADHAAVRHAARAYRRRLAGIGLAALALDIATWFLSPGPALAAGIALVLATGAACYANYYAAHRALQRVKEAEGWFAGRTQVIAAETRGQERRSPSWWWSAPAWGVFLSVIAIGIWRYPQIPERFPIHFTAEGTPTQWATKSVGSVFGTCVPGLLLLLINLLVHTFGRRSRIDVDPEAPADSVQRQAARNRRWIAAFWVSCTFAEVGLGMASLVLWGMLSPASAWAIWGMPLVIVLGAILPWVVALILPGPAPRTTADTPAPGATAPGQPPHVVHRDDDRFWKAGVFYVNPDDPAFLVPKRFGVGWTFNFGHRAAWWGMLALLALAALPGVVVVLAVSLTR